MISKAIVSKDNNRARLSDIYDYMILNYSYFADRQDLESRKQWTNSVRHNLSSHKSTFKLIKPRIAQNRYGEKMGGHWTLYDDALEEFFNEKNQSDIDNNEVKSSSTRA